MKTIIKDFKSNIISIKQKWIHSTLSSLGIIIAIISLIVMISVSEGAKEKTIKGIENLGINTIRIKNIPYSNISSQKENLSVGLTNKDFIEIKNILKNYGVVAPVYINEKKSLYLNNTDITSTIYGSNENFLLIENLDIIKGRNLFSKDMQDITKSAIVSSDIYEKYKLDINKNFIMDNEIYNIVGICQTKDNLKNFIFIPYAHFNPLKPYDNINIYLKDIKDIFILSNIIEKKLLSLHNNIKNFTLQIPLEIVNKQNETIQTFNIVLLSIAIMSLLSGGISIMNAVLSNISEQTREIGLKMALGASEKRIVQFYLIYTLILTVFSGVVGGIVSFIVLYILSIFTSIYVVFSIKAFFIGFLISIISGIFFGLYPALRAANIEPIQALREV